MVELWMPSEQKIANTILWQRTKKKVKHACKHTMLLFSTILPEWSENILSARMFEIHYELKLTHCQGLFWVKTSLPKAVHSSSFSISYVKSLLTFKKSGLSANSLMIYSFPTDQYFYTNKEDW